MDLTQEDWAAQLKDDDNAFILDVRTADEVEEGSIPNATNIDICLLYTSPSPRDQRGSRMPSSA